MSMEVEYATAFFVAGFRYGEGYEILNALQVGDAVDLIAEPGNPHDSYAVRVQHRRSRIGYVPRACNRVLSEALARGEQPTARIVGVAPDRPGWEVVRVRVFGTTNGGGEPGTTSGRSSQ